MAADSASLYACVTDVYVHITFFHHNPKGAYALGSRLCSALPCIKVLFLELRKGDGGKDGFHPLSRHGAQDRPDFSLPIHNGHIPLLFVVVVPR